MKFFFLAHENHLVPDISTYHNGLIINVIHFVVQGVVKDNFFVVAGEFCHAGTDRTIYNLVIIAVGEVKSTIVVVVGDIVVNHNYRFPAIEDCVGDDGSKGRAADDVVAIDVAAIDAVVEVVRHSVVVNRSDVVRDVHVAVIVVVVRVHVGSVRGGSRSRSVSRSMFSGTSGLSVVTAFVVTVVVSRRCSVARTSGYRLRSRMTLFGVTSFSLGR